MTANYQAFQFWYTIFTGLVTLGMFFYVRRVARQKATEQRFKSLEESMESRPLRADIKKLFDEKNAACIAHCNRTTEMEKRSEKLQSDIAHLPTHQQMMELNRSITGLSGELRNTQGRLEGINRAVDLINEFLINQGSKN